MITSDAFRHSTIPLTHGRGAVPVVGFGTLITDLVETKRATTTALEEEEEEEEEGEWAMPCGRRSRPERFSERTCSSPRSCGTATIAQSASSPPSMRAFVDFNSTMPIAIYDDGVTLAETWGAMEALVDDGHCGAIGLSDIILDTLREIVAVAGISRIAPISS